MSCGGFKLKSKDKMVENDNYSPENMLPNLEARKVECDVGKKPLRTRKGGKSIPYNHSSVEAVEDIK